MLKKITPTICFLIFLVCIFSAHILRSKFFIKESDKYAPDAALFLRAKEANAKIILTNKIDSSCFYKYVFEKDDHLIATYIIFSKEELQDENLFKRLASEKTTVCLDEQLNKKLESFEASQNSFFTSLTLVLGIGFCVCVLLFGLLILFVQLFDLFDKRK